MKIVVRGIGEVTLTQKNFVAAGGQASVYVKDGTAFKIYLDPKDAIPEAKFSSLAAISDAAVIKPERMILDEKKTPIGYTMRAIADNFSLCQLFTRAFRERNQISSNAVIDIVGKLRNHVSNVHAAGLLIVDLNELNILVPKSFDETFLIDVDSYQAPGYPATVIMPSVRDYSVHAADFSPLSDWFSFSVLAFQLLVGSHPYKGTHAPSATIDKDHRLVHRMKNHISAFQPDVSLPKCCYPIDSIPQVFRDWLRAVLQDGKRLAPPDPHGIAVAPVVQTAAPLRQSGNIAVSVVFDLDGDTLMSYAESNGRMLVCGGETSRFRVRLDSRYVRAGFSAAPIVGFTPKMASPIGFALDGEQFTFHDFDRGTTEKLPFRVQTIVRAGDRFYVKNGTKILELEFRETAAATLVTASHMVADVIELASQLYEGVAVQNMLGSIFVSLFPRSRAGYQVRIPELDAYKVIDAKFEGGVLMVIGARAGRYDRLVFRFDPDFTTYDVRAVTDIDPAGVNFVVLDSGVCVSLTEDEAIEAFSAKKDSVGVKTVKDETIGADMRLIRVGGKVGFVRGDKIYSLTLK